MSFRVLRRKPCRCWYFTIVFVPFSVTVAVSTHLCFILSSFMLSYATVSRPFCSLELTLTGPHQRNQQIHSGKGFIGSFDLHDLSDLRSLILIPMECTYCGRNNTSWRKLYTPLNHMHEDGSDLLGMHIPTSCEPPTLRTLLVVYSSYYVYNKNGKTYSIT